MVQFFIQEKEHKLDINITVVTSEATGISEWLMHAILKEGKGPHGKEELCFSTCDGKKRGEKIIVYVDPSRILLLKFQADKNRRPYGCYYDFSQ